MGGMLALAHVAAAGSHAMASVTALGSPTDFSKVRSGLVDALMAARPLLRLTPIMPLPFLGRLVLPFINGTSLGFFHSANTDPNTSRMTVALASEIVTSSELWLNFGRFVETQSFGRKTGEPYLENLPASEVPIMVIAGAQDLMAPSDSVVSLCEGAPHAGERISVILGRASGCVEDYGHVDLLVGDRVEEEVFPRILQWIEDHDTNAASGESGRTEGPP
jgi:polyhydroxyalkanoate synthase